MHLVVGRRPGTVEGNVLRMAGTWGLGVRAYDHRGSCGRVCTAESGRKTCIVCTAVPCTHKGQGG